jgi:hypothetical protein
LVGSNLVFINGHQADLLLPSADNNRTGEAVLLLAYSSVHILVRKRRGLHAR